MCVCVCTCSETRGGGRLGVNRNNLLLRGCVLRNTTRVAGLVVYAGICLCIYMYYVYVYLYGKCVGVHRHHHGVHIPYTTVMT